MAGELAKMWVEIGAKTEGFAKGLATAEARLGRFSGFVKRNEDALKRIGLGMTVMGTALAAGLTVSVKAAMAQEDSMRKLEAAIKASGKAIDAMGLSELAKDLQEVTVYSDEDTRAMQTRLIALGATEAQTRKLTPLVQDLAAMFNLDLTSAGALVGKAMIGITTAMRRMGIVIEETSDPVVRLERIIAALDTRVKGAAVTMGDTATGKIIRMKNAVDELNEALGQGLMNTLAKLAPNLIVHINDLRKWAENHSALTEKLVATTAALAAFSLVVGPMLMALPGLVKLVESLRWALFLLQMALVGDKTAIAAVMAVLAGGGWVIAAGLVVALGVTVHKMTQEWRDAGKAAKDAGDAMAEAIKRGAVKPESAAPKQPPNWLWALSPAMAAKAQKAYDDWLESSVRMTGKPYGLRQQPAKSGPGALPPVVPYVRLPMLEEELRLRQQIAAVDEKIAAAEKARAAAGDDATRLAAFREIVTLTAHQRDLQKQLDDFLAKQKVTTDEIAKAEQKKLQLAIEAAEASGKQAQFQAATATYHT